MNFQALAQLLHLFLSHSLSKRLTIYMERWIQKKDANMEKDLKWHVESRREKVGLCKSLERCVNLQAIQYKDQIHRTVLP